MNVVGRIVSGDFDTVRVRQKASETIEMGDLLVAEGESWITLLQVHDLMYGSQIPEKEKNLVAGMKLEGYGRDLDFTDPELSNYIIADLKSLVTVEKNGELRSHSPKKLPQFFSGLRRVIKEDFSFIQAHEKPLSLGNIRSGSSELDVEITLPGEEVLRHHILVPASTGKGKSNLVKAMSWELLNQEYCGQLIIDPHDEYIGTAGTPGLSNHPDSNRLLEPYSPGKNKSGINKLVINIQELKPWDLIKVIDLSNAQTEAINAYYQKHGQNWIKKLLLAQEPLKGVQEVTLETMKRKLGVYLDIHEAENELICKGIFDEKAGKATIDNIINALESSKTVILDTSNLEAKIELLIGSIIANRLFNRYKNYKSSDKLKTKPVVSIVLEEAPRVIGENSVMKSGNIFEKIAREGRKFKIGMTAITQLPSVIPREILANMNTKIILGMEMGSERKSIVQSASQDLSKDDRNIASLDKGEAIVTSTFTDFAIPIKIPYFDEIAEKQQKEPENIQFRGIT
ncbi:ATP-binding protein [Methanonatronarchaeum sp. AMET-Sl]|uniref:ATP-binding protein n=1 Tax=Methanonatronarchaeum sp. AMET-Sl TaxID=3037654 RepID=UPI00244DA5B4|nr:ATP-binding protein [Methanonatronarchaeum sp. AMET-Sl]WGI17519.1 ATP-binding protein [Methanonatronarchaeum sp. AMET-Sl]